MSEDIVARLRAWNTPCASLARDFQDAADEIERLRAHVEALQQKIDADKSCACAYDAPDDVCLPHSPVVAELRVENDRLRAALANSDQPCAYCSLPAAEWAKCASGFPGCERADDAMGCPELGASLERDQLRANLTESLRLMEPVDNGYQTHMRYGDGSCWVEIHTSSARPIADFVKRMRGGTNE